jgi:hypothetical protein
MSHFDFLAYAPRAVLFIEDIYDVVVGRGNGDTGRSGSGLLVIVGAPPTGNREPQHFGRMRAYRDAGQLFAVGKTVFEYVNSTPELTLRPG